MMESIEYLQNHSQAHSLDISHIINKSFGILFSADKVDPEIIENLKVSQGSSDQSHVEYVEELINITTEREGIFKNSKFLRDHILWAKDEALKDDEMTKEKNKDFEYLNLPSEESNFFKYIDNNLLRMNGLIAPEDIFTNLQNNRIESLSRESSFSDLNSSPLITNRKDDKVLSSKKKEYRLPPIEKPATQDQIKKRKSEKKRNPTDMMLASEKYDSKAMLELMTAKNNFLKNPRYLIPNCSNESKNWLIQSNKDSCSQKMFLPIPEVVEFSDYEVGKVYQKLINFRNLTTVLRRIRVLPPKTKYFSLGLGQFPGEQGLVAAGISCQYAIRFSPDSLGDYEDEIVVETQGDMSFSVKIIGKRPRPILTGSTNWDINYCLIYGLKVVCYKIKNIGGSGKFCIADSILQSIPNSKAVIYSAQTVLDPFIIRPSHFELRTNETINLELIFCPTSLGKVEREFNIICDNCHTDKFKITGFGEMAFISVETVEGGISVPEIDETTDISAQILLKFTPLNPYTYSQKTIILKNESHTEIPFCWKIVKPNLKSSSVDTENIDLNILKNRTLDFESAFVIEPQFGVFPPNESLPFTITFAPLEVKGHHSVFHLVLQGIADLKPDQTKSIDEGLIKQKTLVKTFDDGFIESQNSLHTQNTFKMGEITLNDVTSLEIEVKGTSIPLKVRFNTPSIIVPGELLINTPVRKHLQIINESMCPVSLVWSKPESEDFIFEVEPKIGMIDTKEIGVVDVCIVANKPGFFRDTLLCHVDTLDDPIELIVEANFKGPDLEIDRNDLDFGLVKVNETVRRSLKLLNKSSINCTWRSRVGGTNDTSLFEEMFINPKGGILGPLQSQNVIINFTPSHPRLVNCGIEFSLEHGSTKFLNVLACAQSPSVVLSSSKLDVSGILFVNTPSTFTIELTNQSHLISSFNWQMPIGREAELISIYFDPDRGIIEPNGKTKVKLTITCQAQTELRDIFLPCSIEGVDDPICLHISGKVLGPNLNVTIFEKIDSMTNEPKFENGLKTLHFGKNIAIFQNTKRFLLIENTTSIVTNFEISIDHFKTSSNDTEAGKLIKLRPNLADRQSKPQKLADFDFNKSMLKLKNGLAVGFNPSSGTLQSYDKMIIEVSAYNDMWGEYNDFVRISGFSINSSIEQVIIPVSITVVGSPLEFTMTAGRKEQKPILRLGSKTFGEEPNSRKIRINNKSCCDIFINWEMYKKDLDSDEKILDIILSYDDPFPILTPLKDSDINLDSDRTVGVNVTNSNVSDSTRMVTDRNLDIDNFSSRFQEIISTKRSTDNFISLTIRPHEGIISNEPLTFQPEQLVIPSDSYGFVIVTFDPHFVKNEKELQFDENEGASFDNYLLGFLSLEDHNLMLDNRMLRQHQYEVEQIKLDITARILLPNLQVDYPDSDERDEISFSVPFSSLLLKAENDYLLAKSKSFTSYLTLRNLKDAEMKFTLKTRSPFEIGNGKNIENREIKIGETIKVPVKFVLDREQILLLKDENLYGHNESHCLKIERQLLPNEQHRTAKMVQFRDVLTVNYNNTKLDQLIQIRAQIHFPEFIVSKSQIEFPTCFIRETITDYIRIVNKSKSASYLFLKLVNPTDSVFELNKFAGLIQFSEMNSEESELEVQIMFTPKQAIDYSASLIISGIMGEEQISIPISARGSYDNKYQKD